MSCQHSALSTQHFLDLDARYMYENLRPTTHNRAEQSQRGCGPANFALPSGNEIEIESFFNFRQLTTTLKSPGPNYQLYTEYLLCYASRDISPSRFGFFLFFMVVKELNVNFYFYICMQLILKYRLH